MAAGHGRIHKAGRPSARMQGNSKVENLEPKRKVAASATGKERGLHKLRLETESGEEKLVTAIVSEVELRGKQYCTTPSGLLIPEEWSDVYEWIVSRKAPKEWREAMARSAPTGYSEVKAAKESHGKW